MPTISNVGHDDHDLQILELRLYPPFVYLPSVSPMADDAHGLPDLELRLGPTSVPEPESSRILHSARTNRLGLTGPSPPSPDEDYILINHFVPKKRKRHVAALQTSSPEPPKDLRLTCPICMDSMRDETSTLCGHLFCKGCILAALSVQQKCPTCRESLIASQIHRIYTTGCLG